MESVLEYRFRTINFIFIYEYRIFGVGLLQGFFIDLRLRILYRTNNIQS